MNTAARAPGRILMTGSRIWTNQWVSTDALNAALVLLGPLGQDSVLVHGGAKGADQLLASTAQQLGMNVEAHPARWNEHTDACPAWDKKNASCKLAGHRRNSEMIQAGADLCLAFPTHGHALAPGEDRANTSRGTWNCAEKAKDAGIPTLVVWGQDFYPFGYPAANLLRSNAALKRMDLGHQGQMAIIDVWLPF